MKCYVIKDLLPNYIDGLNSDETNLEISAHLDECDDCRAAYERMTAEMPQEVQQENNDFDFLKRLKAKILRKNVIVALFTCIFVLGSLIVFARTYEIPIPFDRYRMTAELIPSAVVINEDGSSAWWDLNDIEPPEDTEITLGSGTVIPKDYEYVMDVLHIAYQGFSNISDQSIGRNINRNGEDVRVVYYRYTKTPWVSLFFDYDLTDFGESGQSTGTNIYGDSFQSADYEPQMIEIYYLPVKDLLRLYDLSDEDYDAQRENGALIWSGVI